MLVSNVGRFGSSFRKTLVTAATSLASLAGVAAAQDVVRVEEDWVLRVNEPDRDVTCPQFHTVMSPIGNIDSYYAQVVWNYREFGDDFVAGGLQLQGWSGDSLLKARAIGNAPLSTTAETVTWTQVLEVDQVGAMSFEIANGRSSTWGEFDKDMRLNGFSRYDDLNQYSTDTSVANACITFGTNRVAVLEVVEVRRYAEDGLLLSVDGSRHVVFQYAE